MVFFSTCIFVNLYNKGVKPMERKKASDFPQEVLNLFDLYIHGDINRRDFMDGASKVVGTIAAAAMLEALTPNYSMAQQVAPNDSKIKGSWETYDSPGGTGQIKGYLVRPANATGKLPGVLVVHENRGLNPYVQDVVRRLAVAGFMAFGPDGLSSLGGYPGNWTSYTPGKKVDDSEVTTADNKGAEMQRSIDGRKLAEDWVNGAKWLKARSDCTGKIGAVGFCYGGGVCNNLAVRLGADLAAAAPYYGSQASAEDAAKIKAELCLHYAENDARITGNWPNYTTALDANKVKYEVYVYAGAQHGFHNDSTARYDKASADLSWQRTLAFFNRTLKS
jgi:carboxymethylenebutenolidase